MVIDGLAVGALILGRKDQAPGNACAGDLRFVGKEAVEAGAILLVVGLVDLADEVIRDLAIQRVHVEGVDIVVEAVVLKATDNVLPTGILKVGGKRAHTQVLLLVLRPLTVNNAAAEAGGPAVLVISPCVHAALFGLVHAGADIFKPLLAHILGLQTAAGVHKEAANADVIHQLHLPQGLGYVQFFIPRPKRYRTVFFSYLFEIHYVCLL